MRVFGHGGFSLPYLQDLPTDGNYPQKSGRKIWGVFKEAAEKILISGEILESKPRGLKPTDDKEGFCTG
jgi:hypothetical protein